MATGCPHCRKHSVHPVCPPLHIDNKTALGRNIEAGSAQTIPILAAFGPAAPERGDSASNHTEVSRLKQNKKTRIKNGI
jgi:hypothetical protein